MSERPLTSSDVFVGRYTVDLARTVDLIVLAQASMARLVDVLQEETGLPVLASPRLGVDYLARRVAELSA
jgi:Asp/Glu/hydantoin racemase